MKLGRPRSRYTDDPTEGVEVSSAPSWEDLSREVKKLRKMYNYPTEDGDADAVVCYTIALQDGMSRLVRVSVPKVVFEENSAMLTQPDLHACTLEKCGQEMLALALRGGR